ncbi:MAG: DUF2478 domain-containing protein [Phycisphaerae bacterium]|nr:DUF2478 domain-containing protein [Phycisphaerae bacterium]
MTLKILSADRGRGKTSFLRRYVADAAGRGRSVGGIASPAVFENGRRIGYDLIDLRRGSQRPLARMVGPGDTPADVGRYRFDEAAVAEGNAAVIAAVRDGLDVVAIDEIGPLELRGKGWAPALEFALREGDYGAALSQDGLSENRSSEPELIIVIRSSLVADLAGRFPSPAWSVADHISPGVGR